MDAVVGIPGAEPWSSTGSGVHARAGIVVTHGFTSSPAATRPLGQMLAAQGYTVEVPLLAGHGTHHRDLGRTRYADWVADVERLVDHLADRCEQVVLVGHSVGGTISLDVASRRVADVAAVVVINPQILKPTQFLTRFAPIVQFLVPYVPRDLGGMPTDDVARPDVEEGAYRLVPARAARSLIGELPRIRSQLPDLIQPLLVVWSPDDHTVPAANARCLLELVGSADVRELVCERSYHLPQLDYDADRVEASVAAFVAEVTGP